MQLEIEVWRGATIEVPQKEAQRGVQTAMKVTGEENPPGTPPTTGEEAMENETAETDVRKGAFNLTLKGINNFEFALFKKKIIQVHKSILKFNPI